jgi:hypothetical protein
MKKVLAALFLIAPLFVGVGVAQAQVDADVRVEVGPNENAENNRQNGDTPTTDAERSNTDNKGASANASTTGQLTAEAHRSSVASFVQSLLSVADRDGGIGAEVRAVAQSQQESASTTAEAVAKVEGRSKVMTFLFGSDWKNLGSLRSEAAKAAADMKKLEAALDDATSASVRADLEAQITVLKEQQEELVSFIAEHESSFSLFGWFTKLFVKAEA